MKPEFSNPTDPDARLLYWQSEAVKMAEANAVLMERLATAHRTINHLEAERAAPPVAPTVLERVVPKVKDAGLPVEHPAIAEIPIEPAALKSLQVRPAVIAPVPSKVGGADSTRTNTCLRCKLEFNYVSNGTKSFPKICQPCADKPPPPKSDTKICIDCQQSFPNTHGPTKRCDACRVAPKPKPAIKTAPLPPASKPAPLPKSLGGPASELPPVPKSPVGTVYKKGDLRPCVNCTLPFQDAGDGRQICSNCRADLRKQREANLLGKRQSEGSTGSQRPIAVRPEPVKCPHCAHMFANPLALDVHVSNLHSVAIVKPFFDEPRKVIAVRSEPACADCYHATPCGHSELGYQCRLECASDCQPLTLAKHQCKR